jgi:hypothetical protein
MDKKRLKRWLIRQFLPSRSHARPAREATETVTIAVLWLGVVFAVLRWECLERPIVSRGFDGGHVFAEGVPVDVVRAGTSHQFVGHVVDGDHVLVFSGILVTLVGHFDHSGGFNTEAELFPLRAFLCRLVRFKSCGLLCTHGLLAGFGRPVPGVTAPGAFLHTPEGTVLPTISYVGFGIKLYDILRRSWI